MSAEDIFYKALLHLRPNGTGWLSNFISFWIEPKRRIDTWFAGENEKIRVWDFHVADEDVDKFLAIVPDAEERDVVLFYGSVYRVRVNKEAESKL